MIAAGPISTSGSATTLLSIPAGYGSVSPSTGNEINVAIVKIFNRGGVDGQFSTDGNNWALLPAGVPVGPLTVSTISAVTVQVRPIPSGSDISSVWGYAA